jgi:hypothetical protein
MPTLMLFACIDRLRSRYGEARTGLGDKEGNFTKT